MATSIIEHFSNILKHLTNFSNEINENNLQEMKEKYKIQELKKGIEEDIQYIENMLQETLTKKEEDQNNTEISEEVKNVILAMHEAAIDIHNHFLNIAYNFIQYIETLNNEILNYIKEEINNGVVKLEELKEINEKLREIIDTKNYEV